MLQLDFTTELKDTNTSPLVDFLDESVKVASSEQNALSLGNPVKPAARDDTVSEDSADSDGDWESCLNDSFDVDSYRDAQAPTFEVENAKFGACGVDCSQTEKIGSQDCILKEITNEDCCASQNTAQQRADVEVKLRRVHFCSASNQVFEIPVLTQEARNAMYTSIQTISAEASRNRREWDYELRNVYYVVEESSFIADCQGNLWHPVHWQPLI